MGNPYVPTYKRNALKKPPLTDDWATEQDPDKAGSAVCELLQQLVSDQTQRLFDNTRYMSLYSNTNFLASFSAGGQSITMPRMCYNLIKVCTDTLVGMLIQSNSRVVMNTVGGNWNDGQKARKIELALEGEWSRMRLYKEAGSVAIDAIVSGVGYLKLYRDKDKVACERLFPNEVFVDEAEAAYGPPTKMYQVRYIKKDKLLKLYPSRSEAIQRAAEVKPPNFPWTRYDSGVVEVVEAWALGQRHIISVDTGCLVDEPYPYTTFPIISFHAGLRPFGWYGQGFVEQTFDTQLVLNQTLAVMQEAAALGIAPFWVIQEGAGINVKHLANEVGHIVTTNSLDPKWVTNPPFHPDATAYVEQLANFILNFFGLNPMQTAGEVQTNRLDSRKALVEFQDIAATRHTALLERWEDFFIQAAKSTVALCQQIAKSKGGYPVVSKKGYQVAIHLDWKDLDLEGNAHVFTPAPSSLLSRTPAGKLNDINDMLTMGLISKEQAQKAMRGAPDVDALVQESTALDDHIDFVIAKITDEEIYTPPDTYTATPHTIMRMRNAKLEYTSREAPQKILSMFDDWIGAALDIKKQQDQEEAQQQQQMAAAAQQPPQGAAPNVAGPTAGIPSPAAPAVPSL